MGAGEKVRSNSSQPLNPSASVDKKLKLKTQNPRSIGTGTTLSFLDDLI
jgi:hypothetical protein